MTDKIRWGIVSTGRIARQFAEDFEFVENGELWAVCSRSQEAADHFSAQYRVRRAYSSYAAMLEDENIDAVYVATPHNLHFQNAADAIAAGKAVLCEKPLTVNVQECLELTRLATDAGVYLMEAMWTYFLPAVQKARQWVKEGRIGHVLHVKADFGYPIPYNPEHREYNVENAGGCLLDMGIYPVAMAWYFLQQDPESMRTVARMAPNGVENDVVTLCNYPHSVATLACSFHARLPNLAYIVGEAGYIAIPDFWRAGECRLYELDTEVDRFTDGRRSLGFNYEATAVAEDLIAGRLQSTVMPLSNSLRFQEHMERIRQGFQSA
jgi:predicted dehydrogenase